MGQNLPFLREGTELSADLMLFTCRAGDKKKVDIITLKVKESSPWKAETDEKLCDSVLVSGGCYQLHLVLLPKLRQLVLGNHSRLFNISLKTTKCT